jgi:hypothetical protein
MKKRRNISFSSLHERRVSIKFYVCVNGKVFRGWLAVFRLGKWMEKKDFLFETLFLVGNLIVFELVEP